MLFIHAMVQTAGRLAEKDTHSRIHELRPTSHGGRYLISFHAAGPHGEGQEPLRARPGSTVRIRSWVPTSYFSSSGLRGPLTCMEIGATLPGAAVDGYMFNSNAGSKCLLCLVLLWQPAMNRNW